LDHDLQHPPRLLDEDREAIEDQYSIIPMLISNEAIAMRDAATEHTPLQQSTDDDEPKSLEKRIEGQRQELLDAMAIVAAMRDSVESDDEDNLIFRAA